MSQSQPPDSFVTEAAARGYTPDNLPALRQYLQARDCANIDAAKRIQENLRAVFDDQSPEST